MAYGYFAEVTIDNTYVAANETDFPILISGTYDGTGGGPDIRTVGNGGNIENTSTGGASGAVTVPADLVFSSNTDGSSPYDFEIQSYNSSTGEIIAWIKIPSLSSSADTTFYMVYGDSSVTTSQEDVANTWSDNFEAVWHMSEASGTLYDSTSNNHNLTTYNTPTYGATGKIGDCVSFDDGSNEYARPGAAPVTAAPLTMSCWINTDDYSSAEAPMWVGDSANHNSQRFLILLLPNGVFRFYTNSASSTATDSVSVDTWHHVAGVTSAADDRAVLVDAGNKGSNTSSATPSGVDDASVAVGYSANNYPWSGMVDEVRIASSSRDDDYITTAYNTQNDPGTFYSVGSEQTSSSDVTFSSVSNITWSTQDDLSFVLDVLLVSSLGLSTNTPDLASAEVDRSLSSVLAPSFSLPDNVALPLSVSFSIISATSSIIPDDVLVGLLRSFSSTSLSSSSSSESASLALEIPMVGGISASITSTDVVLLIKDIPISSVSLASTITTDVADLEVVALKLFSAILSLSLSTTDLASVVADLGFEASSLSSTSSLDLVSIEVDRAMSAQISVDSLAEDEVILNITYSLSSTSEASSDTSDTSRILTGATSITFVWDGTNYVLRELAITDIVTRELCLSHNVLREFTISNRIG